jgi:hypothetical protein
MELSKSRLTEVTPEMLLSSFGDISILIDEKPVPFIVQ